jgi:hypothetical protein
MPKLNSPLLKPSSSERAIAKELVAEMDSDNGGAGLFTVTKKDLDILENAVKEMTARGVNWTSDIIAMFAGGDQDEIEETFGTVPGFAELHKQLNVIFDGKINRSNAERDKELAKREAL